ncbi:hypothetical protein ACHAWF_008540 [Thalassiosira exigua]
MAETMASPPREGDATTTPQLQAVIANATTFGEAFDTARDSGLLRGQGTSPTRGPIEDRDRREPPATAAATDTSGADATAQPAHAEGAPTRGANSSRKRIAASDDGDGWTWPRPTKTSKVYQGNLSKFMSWFHEANPAYKKDEEFTREELLEIKPSAVHDYFALNMFGKTDYEEDEPVKEGGWRWNTLDFQKKSFSYFMPNKKPEWCEGRGNPTKAEVVHKLMRHVKKLEVRGLGAPSRAKRPMSREEFVTELELLKKQPDWNHRVKYVTMCLWQYHLIGRADDTCHFEVDDPKGHVYDFALQTKVRWSKNVLEERGCPDQILLGANSPIWCILIHLGVYMESYLQSHPNAKLLFTEKSGMNAADNLKATWSSRLRKVVWSKAEFEDVAPEGDDSSGIGTHSTRKFSTDFAANCGCSTKEVEIRGRWKHSRGNVVFVYIDVKKKYEDAKVAGVLCVGGPIKYELKDEVASSISLQWIYDNVVPSIRHRYPRDSRLCCNLGLAMLYACLCEDEELVIPEHIRTRVKTAYEALGLSETQPVKKVHLCIIRVEDQLHIEPVTTDVVVVGAAENATGGGIGANNAATHAMHANTLQALLIGQRRSETMMSQYHMANQASIFELRNWTGSQLRAINNNLRAFGGTIPGGFAIQRQRHHEELRGNNPRSLVILGDANGHILETPIQPARLCDRPSSLMMLWQEYKVGVNGNKPAEQFTRAEKADRTNGTRQKYHDRRNIWKLIEKLVKDGFTAEVAINKIHQVYGYNTSITKIIKGIVADKKRGGHPNLK